jgi:outer membrane protein assembly factor BamB/tetratricopeptide (TPR) repeat protein
MAFLNRHRILALIIASAFIGGAAWCLTAHAQVHVQIGPIHVQLGVAGAADDVPTPDQPDGVFVRESPAAMDTFKNGQRMERLKEWDKAADFYQEVVEKYRDRVIPSAEDADHHATQYTSIVKMVQDQLCKWPAEGRAAYLARYEVAAQTLLASAKAGDPANLHQVYERYFVTIAGKEAGIRLIDGYLEGGQYRAAAVIGERLLASHPDMAGDAAAVLYRTALAHHFSGHSAAADAMLGRLQADHPADRGTIRGQDVVLVDSLRSELKGNGPPSTRPSTDAEFWPMAWGDPSRSRISSAVGKPGVHLYAVPLSKPGFANMPGADPSQRAQMEQAFNQEVSAGGTIGVMPVTDHGDLFFQDGQKIYARNLESDLPLPGWLQTYPAGGDYVLAGASASTRTAQTTVTVTRDDVLAVMGQPDRQVMMNGGMVEGGSRLVCLDRETGREKWIALPGKFPDSAAALRDAELSSSPLVIGQSVLLLAHGGAARGVQFDDTYVISFDLNTGKYQWSCYIASANVAGIAGMYAPGSDGTSHLAYADGLVYAQTNLGAIAAIDPFGQSLVWVDIYPTRTGNMEAINPFQPMLAAQNGAGPIPWTSNPVIASDGAIFTLPSQGKSVLIYDSISGALLKSIPLSDLHECDALLGVSGDRVILSGQKVVVSIDWKKYDPKTFTGDDLNSYPFPDVIRGRGFVTKSAIFVPLKDRLYWLDPTAKALTFLGAYPSLQHTWEEGQGPGNVLVTDTHVIVAGATSVDVYTDLALAQKNLDRVIAANPADPEPHLRYAVLMFGAKDPDAAMQRLDEAVGLMGGPAGLRAGAQRDELFGDTMTFAGSLAPDERPGVRQRAEKFYDRAAIAAYTPLQQIHWRLGRAHLAIVMNDPVTAVKVCQEILSDENLRPVSLPDPQTASPTQAGVLAEKGIAALIKSNPQAYAPFEQAAADAFADARRSSDDLPARLIAVAKTYPNSSVAPQAMLAAADAYESAGNPRMALQAARQLYFRTPEGSADLPRILETMVRNYLIIPGRTDVVAAAAARLAQGAALPGDPMLEKPLRLPDNQILERMRFSQALEQVRKYSGDKALRALPDFRLPMPATIASPNGRAVHAPRVAPFLPVGPDSVIGDIAALIRPLRDQSRFDRVVALGTNGKLEIFSPGHAQPLAIADLPADEAPARCAWMGSDILIWGASQMSMVREDGGPALWNLDLKQIPQTQVVRSGDSQAPVADPNADAINVNNNRVIIHGNGRVMLPNGVVLRAGGFGRRFGVPMPLVQAPQPLKGGGPERIEEVIPVGDRVLLSTTAGRIICTDLAQGVIVWQMRLSEQPIERLVANEDFAVALAPDGDTVRLVAMDTFSGDPRGSRNFVSGPNQFTPVNMALSADGTLVYTLPDRLCLKNLYAAWPDPSDREVIAANGISPFRVADGAASGPDQLVIAEGRILALADEGGRRVVRVHSLETGNPIPLRFAAPQGNQQIDKELIAGTKWDVSLHVLGSHVYAIGSDIQASYNLDEAADSWVKDVSSDPPRGPVRDVIFGKRYLVMIQGPAPTNDPAQGKPPLYSLRAIGLYPAPTEKGEESGRLDYPVQIKDPGVLTGDWQGFNGGFCYLTADHKLHMLMGAAEAGK